MSKKASSVSFKFDYSSQEVGGAGNAIGPTVPQSVTAGNTYTFVFQNNTADTDTTSGTTFDYDLGCFQYDSTILLSGSMTGNVPPGESATVSFRLQTTGDGQDQDAAAYSLQAGAAPLVTIPNLGTVCFWFFTDGETTNYQQIDICNNDQSSLPISSTPVQTSTQMQCLSSATGLSITLDGGGFSPLTTNNIYIEIANAT